MANIVSPVSRIRFWHVFREVYCLTPQPQTNKFDPDNWWQLQIGAGDLLMLFWGLTGFFLLTLLTYYCRERIRKTQPKRRKEPSLFMSPARLSFFHFTQIHTYKIQNSQESLGGKSFALRPHWPFILIHLTMLAFLDAELVLRGTPHPPFFDGLFFVRFKCVLCLSKFTLMALAFFGPPGLGVWGRGNLCVP